VCPKVNWIPVFINMSIIFPTSNESHSTQCPNLSRSTLPLIRGGGGDSASCLLFLISVAHLI
jgi:hypothetical protein